MHIFKGENINHVYLDALELALSKHSHISQSRVGNVIDLGPAYFEFCNPEHQVLTLRNRKYNPCFVIAEAAWVLSGKNTLAPLDMFIKGYDRYSDDGKTLNGAYGHRIRFFFEFDQLSEAISALKKDPYNRRAVITLYAPSDLKNGHSKDIPCNTSFYLKIRESKLDITVLNRSNDLFLGVPYNVFIFNCIQKYAANKIGIPVGTQRHFTDSLHLYQDKIETVKSIITTNSKDEILYWQKRQIPEYVYDSILSEYNSIADLKFDLLSCPKTKKYFKEYFHLPHSPQKEINLEKHPSCDILELSFNLWLTSIKK